MYIGSFDAGDVFGSELRGVRQDDCEDAKNDGEDRNKESRYSDYLFVKNVNEITRVMQLHDQEPIPQKAKRTAKITRSAIARKRMLTSRNRRSEDVCILPIVVAALKFRDIERQIFAADFVEASHDAALNQRPNAFNRGPDHRSLGSRY
jgi:hypothetical protein